MKPLAEQTFYEILEVRTDAPSTEIESAYARARELYGPGSLATYSLVSPEEAALLAARIEDAKRILLDPDARARYDAGLAAAAEATQSAVRLAATGSGAVAAGPQRPWVVSSTPVPRAKPEPARPEPEEPPREADASASADAPEAAAKEPTVAAATAVAEASADASPVAEPVPGPPVAVSAAAEPPAAVPEPVAAPPAPVPILLQKEIPAGEPRTFPVPDGAVWSGEALRKVRESRGLSVREVCERTKITRYHLENIEADRFTLLPAPVYLRGIIVAVARELRLDGQKVARSYLERMTAGGADPEKAR